MPKAAAERLATSLLLLALAAQIALSLRLASGPFGGDEPYYVEKARSLVANHHFPRATPTALAVENGQARGLSDWRPQGYPLFVALCSGGNFAPATLRPRVTAVQSLLIALSVFLVFRALGRYATNPSTRIITAIVFGIAPWPFEFAALVGPDSIVASLTAIALLLLGRHPKSVFFATLLFSITFTFRPEMIVLPPLLVACAALIHGRHQVRFVMAGAAAFVVVFAAHYAYRINFTGQRIPPVFGGLHIPDRGAFEWVDTWTGTEHEAYDFVYALTNGQPSPPLPARAFAGDAERRAVDAIVAHVHDSRHYSSEDDAAFENLARRRRREHPALAVGARLWHAAHLWLNTETNSQTLNALVYLPRIIRRAILGALLALKLAALAAFALFLVRVRSFRDDAFLVLCAILVVTRTLLIGVVLGWFTHRYALNAWIPLLACAAAVLRPPRPARPAALVAQGSVNSSATDLSAAQTPRFAGRESGLPSASQPNRSSASAAGGSA